MPQIGFERKQRRLLRAKHMLQGMCLGRIGCAYACRMQFDQADIRRGKASLLQGGLYHRRNGMP